MVPPIQRFMHQLNYGLKHLPPQEVSLLSRYPIQVTALVHSLNIRAKSHVDGEHQLDIHTTVNPTLNLTHHLEPPIQATLHTLILPLAPLPTTPRPITAL